MSNRKIQKPVFKLAIRTPDGFRSESSGECDEGAAFALHMLLMGVDKVAEEGVAGEFQTARIAYLAAATKYHTALSTKARSDAP